MGKLDRFESYRILRDVAHEPSRAVKAWKAAGKKVVGYRCLYVPEELVWAAGMLPHPLYGTADPVGPADAYFQSCTCEFARNLFDLALGEKFQYLDALLLANTCDVVRKFCDVWNGFIPGVPATLFNHPQKILSESNHDYFAAELGLLQEQLEKVSGTKITEERLAEAIQLTNTTRALLRELFELRKAESPPITGEESLAVVMGASLLPKPDANRLLGQLVQDSRSLEGLESSGPRILVTGSLLDNPSLLLMIEEMGGRVVAEDLCTSIRYWRHPVQAAADPREALYQHFNHRPVCACMHPPEARLDYLQELVTEFAADAVIYLNLKYCHPFLYEAPIFKKALEARGIPTMLLEVGHDLSGHGQLRTRLQAFIEMLVL